MTKYLLVISSALLISGCSAYKTWYGSDKPMMSWVVVNHNGTVQHQLNSESIDKDEPFRGYIITWSPEFNGAFVTSSGKGCIQPAMYATTSSGEAAIPTEIFTQGASNGNLTGKYAEALNLLISVTDQSTFLSIGMYGLCQLSVAGGLTQEDTAKLVKLLFEKAASQSPTHDKSNTDTNK